MIVTAAWVLGECYEAAHNEDYYERHEAPGMLLAVVVFMAFDYYTIKLAVTAL